MGLRELTREIEGRKKKEKKGTGERSFERKERRKKKGDRRRENRERVRRVRIRVSEQGCMHCTSLLTAWGEQG